MKRMYSLDVLKLALAYSVAFFHMGWDIPPGPTISVQVFFMISGYFLGRKFYSKQGTGYNQLNYTLDHVKSLYPHYFLSLIVALLYYTARELVWLVKEPSVSQLMKMLMVGYNGIPEFMLLQSSYHWHDGLNYPLWQLSALVIGGYFVYGMLCCNEKLSRTMLFPGAILMIQSLLNTEVDLWGNYGPLFVGLLRAISPLCIGVLTYCFSTTALYSKFRRSRVLSNVAAILGIAAIYLFGEHHNIFLVLVPFTILGCMDPESWLNKVFHHGVFRNCGIFSYAIYLNHAIVERVCYARIYPRLNSLGIHMEEWHQGMICMVILTIYSVVFLWFVDFLRRGFAKRTSMKRTTL